MAEKLDRNGGIALAAGPITAIIAAGVLARFRDDAGAANVALVLAIIVIAAALAGRVAGAVTAVTAALSYNFFHTKPYNSLRINRGHDIVTVVLLVLIGIGVSELSQWRRRTRHASERQHRVGDALEQTSQLLARRADSATVWSTVHSAMTSLLRVCECTFVPGPSAPVPVISRSGALVAGNMRMGLHGFQLPDDGVAIAVVFGSDVLGHIVVSGGSTSSGSSLDERRAAVALADQYAVALAIERVVAGESVAQPVAGSKR